MSKLLILIHGRSTKPSQSAQKRLILRALLNGLKRVDPLAAEMVASGEIRCAFAYYGDINNVLMAAASSDIAKTLTARNDAHHGHAPCLPEEPIRSGIDQHATVQSFDGVAYSALLDAYDGWRWLDEAASLVSRIAAVTNLSESALKWATADMSQYLLTRRTGSEIRERLQHHLRSALLAEDDICLVSHSMGCIVAYDVLWKFSRLSEYREIQEVGNKVNLWVTLGCPLGEPGVRGNLYDANERGHDRYPRHIIKDWVNVAAEDDFVCHDGTMANDFREMRNLGFVNSIMDHAIYNFWVQNGKLDPHNFYGYLDHPLVSQSIARWINQDAFALDFDIDEVSPPAIEFDLARSVAA